MRFNIAALWQTYPRRIALLAVAWFFFIFLCHYLVNSDTEKRTIIKMGYMPVITNLAAPLLDAASADGKSSLRFRAMKFASFAEMAEALRNSQIQAAFIIAPLSIVLNQQGEDVRIVYIGNRHESTFVVRKDLNVKRIEDLTGHTVAVPMRFSGHNLETLKLIDEAGLNGSIHVVEMNPPDMASALAAGSLDAYFVGEPFAAQTLKPGLSQRFFYVEEKWPGFICNLLLVRQSLIDRSPETVQLLVQGAARSNMWAKDNLSRAAQIASRYWGQPLPLVEYALNTPPNRIVFDQFIPRQEEIQQLADLMQRFGLTQKNTINGLVDDRFARHADLAKISTLTSIVAPVR
ncbi:MAG: ABC transporter substrate-binding protein [Desulfobacteraceae bacterium]|nr:ABC transporter substrate-binding protein [Desulfobacteraceae bacterium]